MTMGRLGSMPWSWRGRISSSMRGILARLEDGLNAREGFLEFFLVGAKGNADVTAAVAAEDEAGGDEDAGFVEYAFGEGFYLVDGVGDAPPKEHPHLMGCVGAAEGVHDGFGELAPTGVEGAIVEFVPGIVVVEGGHGSQLEGAERAGVDIGFYFEYPLDKAGIGDEHPHAPARHIVAFRHRVEFDATVFGVWNLKEGETLVVEDEGIGVVVDHNDAALPSEAHQALESAVLCRCTGGHVGIVDPKEPDIGGVHRFKGSKVGLPVVFGKQIVMDHFGTEHPGERCVGGVAGIGHKHFFAGIDEGECDVKDAFFRTDERLDFLSRIEVYLKPALVETRHGLAKFGNAAGGLVAVGGGLLCHGTQCFDGPGRRRTVGAADGEIDDVSALGIESGHFFEFAREVVFLHQLESLSGLDGGSVHGGKE